MRSEELLRELELMENEMEFRLKVGRTRYTHGGGKGSVAESLFRQFLRDYTRLDVGKGEVIDTYDHRSNETDVIIVGRSHPLIFQPEEHSLFLVEGIKAAGEVKSVLSTKDLIGATNVVGSLDKSYRFKKLKAKHTSGDREITEIPYSPTYLPFYVHRPYFLFAYESKISIKTVCKHLKNYAEEKLDEFNQGQANKAPEDQEEGNPFPSMDAVFVLNQGWVINFDTLGSIQNRQADEMKGWKYQKSKTVLADLLSWLSVVMPSEESTAALFYWYTEPW